MKAKDSEINNYELCVGKISKYFTINNLKRKTGLKEIVSSFSVDFNPIDIQWKEKSMLELLIKMFGVINKCLLHY